MSDIVVDGEKICSADSYMIVDDVDYVGKIISDFSHHENSNYEVRSTESGNKGKLIGTITLEHLKEAMTIGEMGEYMLAMDVMETPNAKCTPETSLPDAYQLFTDYDTDAINIVDGEGKPMGVLEKFTVDHYLHKEMLELQHKLTKMEA